MYSGKTSYRILRIFPGVVEVEKNLMDRKNITGYLRMLHVCTLSKKFETIWISVLRDITKIQEKNQPNEKYQKNMFYIRIMPKSYQEIANKNNCSIIN